jgi:uncharacterized integral membrane protein
MQLIWIASLFFAVVIALFAVQNTTPVSVSFLVWRLEAVAVSALVLAAAALGALLTYLFGLRRGIQHRLELRGNRATIRDQEALIADLRARVRELEGAVEAKRPEIEATEPVGTRAVESAGPKPQLAAPDPEARSIIDAPQSRISNP